jgi:MOSC domain-containing protein YiiM
MVSLDPDTAEQSSEVLRAINRFHGNKAGVYGVVLVEGTVRLGDEIVAAD